MLKVDDGVAVAAIFSFYRSPYLGSAAIKTCFGIDQTTRMYQPDLYLSAISCWNHDGKIRVKSLGQACKWWTRAQRRRLANFTPGSFPGKLAKKTWFGNWSHNCGLLTWFISLSAELNTLEWTKIYSSLWESVVTHDGEGYRGGGSKFHMGATQNSTWSVPDPDNCHQVPFLGSCKEDLDFGWWSDN